MITSEKYLLYILGVNKEQLDYLLTHIEDYYYSFERVKFNKFTDKPKKNSSGEIATRQINSSKGKLKEVQTRLYDFMSKQVEIPQYVYGGVLGKIMCVCSSSSEINIFLTDLNVFHQFLISKFSNVSSRSCTYYSKILTKLTS